MLEKKDNTLKSFLFRTLLDPVLIYLTLIMISIMYHYRSSLALIYGVITYIMGWLVLRVFDFINKHKFLGSLAYIALGAADLVAVRMSINKGRDNYPIPFSLWFLSPQDAVEYNQWYTLAIYLLFFMFMASVIYYFTRVRYRIFMNFLIFIIPFAIFGKEYEKMPTIYIILLSVCYVLLMSLFRQFKDDDNTKVVCRHEVWKPLAVYCAAFAVIAAVFPKPHIEADRSYIESLINAEALTDRLNAMLNVFRNTTTAEQFSSRSRNYDVYLGAADEELRLKNSTCSDYFYSSGEWRTNELDKNEFDITGETPIVFSTPGKYLQAYLKAAELDNDFARKYGLEAYKGTEVKIPPVKKAVLRNVYSSQLAPVPQFATELTKTSYSERMKLTQSGCLEAANSDFAYNEVFEYEYSSERFMYLGKNKEIVDAVCRTDYKAMSEEAYDILDAAFYDTTDGDEEDELLSLMSALDEQEENFFPGEEEWLDYGNRSRIKKLADRITEGVDSDYDKAKLFERYFYNNDYIYDLNYVRKTGENAEDFIFDTKTGVCYEYATAMILLSRAAGIPARFCVGYNMTEPNDSEVKQFDFLVTTQSGHAFPELYIKGYGWMSFEPTIADVIEESEDTSATDMLARAGLIILVTSLAILAFATLYPRISHRIFLLLSKRKKPTETARAVMRRICRIYGIEGGCTSNEAAELAAAYSGTDISRTAELFDKAVYGEQELDQQEKEILMEEYLQAYKMHKEAKKLRRKTANSQ